MGFAISPALEYAAKHHDEAERFLGDLPGPAKRRFPELAAEYAKAETIILAEMGHRWTLSRVETAILQICDKLDAVLWAVPIVGWTQEWAGEEWILICAAERIGAGPWLEARLKPLRPSVSVCQFGG